MRNRILLAASALLFATTLSAQPPQKTARADIYNANGEKIGSATLREIEGGVRIEEQGSPAALCKNSGCFSARISSGD